MNSFMPGVALFLLAFPALVVAQTTRDASRVAGSIYPTVIRPASLALPRPSTAAQPLAIPGARITAVCLGSHDDAQCRASMGNTSPSAQIAFCDVQDVGLARCLSRYATAVVKQPEAAARTLGFTVRDAQGVSSTVIVLATATQSEQEIVEAALEGKPGGSVVALRMPVGNSPANHATISHGQSVAIEGR